MAYSPATDEASMALLVFADDWGRHPSSAQHLVRHWPYPTPTLWVNTVGTRTPRLDRETLRRGLGKLRQWGGAGDGTKNQVSPPCHGRVVNPKMWPWLTKRFDRRLNRALLVRQLRPLLAELPEAAVAVTTLPVVADIMGDLAVKRWVYYCVDDFGAWPGLDRRTLARLERDVVAQADVCVAAGERLRERLAEMGREAEVLTHGVDVEFWRQPDPAHAEDVAKMLADCPRPRVVFWGVFDRRMDTDFIIALRSALSGGSIVIIGPEQDGDPHVKAATQAIGPLPLTWLPGVAAAADVLVMPYADLAVTRAMQPLKLKEYLATGKPVIARRLPAVAPWADALDAVETPAAFVAAVLERLAHGVPPEQLQARERLQSESWTAKAVRFAELIGADER